MGYILDRLQFAVGRRLVVVEVRCHSADLRNSPRFQGGHCHNCSGFGKASKWEAADHTGCYHTDCYHTVVVLGIRESQCTERARDQPAVDRQAIQYHDMDSCQHDGACAL